MSLYGVEWFDVILLEHGSREIVFSSKSATAAIDIMEQYAKQGGRAYVVKNIVLSSGKVQKENIDPYENYESYTWGDEE